MTSKLGVYWSVMHRRAQDYDYFKRMQPSVFKIMDGGPPDYQWAKDNLPNSLVIARDWALSEQHADMLRDPVGTGQRHAEEWERHRQRLGFDPAKTLILGINEPQVWNPGVPEALRQYTMAMCDRAHQIGLRVGAMQLSVGWPANTGPDTPPSWSAFTGVEAAIQRGNHALCLHEYWADNGPGENWGWWAGRALKCPWQVPIVIGECGVDMYVKAGGQVPHNQRGWQGRMDANRYARELAEYTSRMSADPRFVGCCVFASDFANREWFSFDVEPAYNAILATPIPQTTTTHLPSVGSGTKPVAVPTLAHPIQDPTKRIISQRFGENPADYEQFGLAGHNGLDFAVPVGTPVQAVDNGRVLQASHMDDYGNVIKLQHEWGESVYAHLDTFQVVAVGALVKRGQTIGLSGNTGNSTGPHLHFAMRISPYKRGAPFDGYSDPEKYLSAPGTPQTPPVTHANVLALIKIAASRFDLDWRLVASLVWAESSFNPNAASSAGAKGLMQIMPATWAEWAPKVGASDPYTPEHNIAVGCAYLAWLLRQTKGSEYKAVTAYNFGIGNVTQGVKPPPATIAYVERVLFGRDFLKAVGA